MFKTVFTISIAFLLLMALPAWGLDLIPGKYEITAKVEMPGMPAGSVPPQTMTQCLTEQDPVPSASTATQGCKITDMKTKGNTVTYAMECDQQGTKININGEMTFKGDTFEGTTEMDMGPSAGGMTVTTKIAGRRVGKCE